MKRTILILLVLAGLSAPSLAANRACNTSLVTQQVCRAATNHVLFYDAPPAALVDLREAIVSTQNYQAEVVCATTRQYDQLVNGQAAKTLVAAGADVDSCAVGQVVANPQSETDFADAWVDTTLRNLVIQYQHQQAIEQANNIGAVPTPDVGTP